MILRMLLPLALALLLAGCPADTAPPPPPTLALTIAGGADQNPDPEGHPTPVAVRIYQLAATAAFERSDVFALTEREQATLGADSLGSEELIVAPGETREVAHELKPGVQAIGIVVLFRDIDHAQWRAVAPAAASGPTTLMLGTSGTSATLAPAEPAAPAS
jgi:type VI secretion system protein VasD